MIDGILIIIQIILVTGQVLAFGLCWTLLWSAIGYCAVSKSKYRYLEFIRDILFVGAICGFLFYIGVFNQVKFYEFE